MRRRSSIVNQLDHLNLLASGIVGEVAGNRLENGDAEDSVADQGKNPHAAALGRLGGKKGGLARALKLSAERRSEIARRAAQARWNREGISGQGGQT